MNFKESKAIYLQIADRICDEVLLGQYQEEERIPSVREYAAVVEVNANTVMRSYDYLQTQGVIYNKRGIGYFVSVGARKLILSLRKEYFSEGGSGLFLQADFHAGHLCRGCPGCIRSLSRNKIKKTVMKRTTYIMIGMLVTGVAMVCGLMFYVVDPMSQKDNFMEIGGERKTVQLPSCRVLKLTQPRWCGNRKKGIVEAERMFLVRGSAVGGNCRRLFAAGQFLLCRGYGGFYVDDFRWRYPARHLDFRRISWNSIFRMTFG